MAEPAHAADHEPAGQVAARDVGRLRAPERVGELQRLGQDVVEQPGGDPRPRWPRARAGRRSSGGSPSGHASVPEPRGRPPRPRRPDRAGRPRPRSPPRRSRRPRRPSPAAPPGRPRPRAPAPPERSRARRRRRPRSRGRGARRAPRARRCPPSSCVRARSAVPRARPATSEPSSTSEPVSSRRGRLDGTRPRQQVPGGLQVALGRADVDPVGRRRPGSRTATRRRAPGRSRARRTPAGRRGSPRSRRAPARRRRR